MRILLTGAGGNVGRGVTGRLRAAGHEVVLSDVVPVPDVEVFEGCRFHQVDVRDGFGLERAIDGCDLVLHTPAWHGIHSGARTEADFWRLDVDGLFWTLQAARAAGVTRFVFMSSMSWFGHYDKYGFTKRVGEELCEYHRQRHGMRYVTVRPADFTPWGDHWLNRYGARLLYGGVDRDDVLHCVERAVAYLAADSPTGEPEAHVVHAVRPNAFTEADLDGWVDDPQTVCDRIFPGARDLVASYPIDITRRPVHVDPVGADAIGYAPRHHFGTFLAELAGMTPAEATAQHCPY